MYDPERYRDKAEVREWQHRDPIALLTDRLRAQRMLTDDDLAGVEAAVAQEVDTAVGFAEAGHDEPVEDLMRFVHAESTDDQTEDRAADRTADRTGPRAEGGRR
jgi:TPP-dependent pyruvate/acetoin dehydrogenase alpha subunit